MKFQGSSLPRSKIDIGGGNSMLNGPLGQLMAFQMLGQKQAAGQQTASQPAPPGMVNTEYSGPFGNKAVNAQGEGQVAAARASATAPIEIQKATDTKQQEEAQQAMLTGETAINQLQYGVSRWKSLQKANQIQQGAPGFIQRGLGKVGQYSGSVGQNPEDTVWSRFTDSVATQLAAAASPRTPTLLVDKYKGILGPSTQTAQEFAGTVHMLIAEIEARKAGFMKVPFDLNMVNKRAQQILSTPAGMDFGEMMNPTQNLDTGIPGGKPRTNPVDQTSSDTKGTKDSPIMMTKDGRTLPVHPKKVADAIKRGYKMPQGV